MSDTAATRTVSALVLAGLVALSVKLALAPFNGTGDADGCAKAYAKARSHVDTVAVDTKSYPDAHIRGLNRRCGEQRKAAVGAIAVRTLPAESLPGALPLMDTPSDSTIARMRR